MQIIGYNRKRIWISWYIRISWHTNNKLSYMICNPVSFCLWFASFFWFISLLCFCRARRHSQLFNTRIKGQNSQHIELFQLVIIWWLWYIVTFAPYGCNSFHDVASQEQQTSMVNIHSFFAICSFIVSTFGSYLIVSFNYPSVHPLSNNVIIHACTFLFIQLFIYVFIILSCIFYQLAHSIIHVCNPS